MLKIVMISGYKRSGKDFVSSKLKELIDDSVVMSIAAPLKDIIATSLDISVEQLDDYKNLGNTLLTPEATYRAVLQRFGTEAMKKWFGDDVWIDLFINNLPKDGVVIVSDWRFKSEYNAVKLMRDVDVTTVRVIDKNLFGDGHISEHDLDGFDFDYTLDNTAKDKSINELIISLISVI